MRLSNNPCKVLGNDDRENILVEYQLIDFPSNDWTNIFNRISWDIDVRSFINSKRIIVIVHPRLIQTKDIFNNIKEKIEETNNQLYSDTLKNEIILRNFISGMIVVHNDLRYTMQEPSENNPEGKSEYELYLSKIINRIEDHDEYESILNSNFSSV